MNTIHIASRRDFLKKALSGAAVLRASGGTGLLAAAEQGAAFTKSRVVIARDDFLRGTGSTVDSRRILSLLDRAMQALFDRDHAIEAWRKLVRPGETVGLKVNVLGGRGISTNLQLVEAICERLQEAGIKPGDIVVWDRDSDEMEHAGFHLAMGGNRLQCFGTDRVDYEEELVAYGSVGSRLSKILTQRSNVLINVPVLKDHDGAGVTIALKNMYGVIQNQDAIDHLRCNHGDVRRRTGIQAGTQLEKQCPDRFAGSRCAGLHRLANY
jgi:DNA-binding Xre family transcriptional regulator